LDPFERQWQRWFSEDSRQAPIKTIEKKWTAARIVSVALFGAFLLFILLSIIKGWYTEWLWFNSLGFGSVYTTILKSKLIIFLVAAALFCALFLGSLVLAARLSPTKVKGFWPWTAVNSLRGTLKTGIILSMSILSLIFGMVAQGNWQVILRTFNSQSFGVTDPVFHREVGFYVFQLPFLNMVHGWLLGAFIIIFLGSIGLYFISYASQRLKFDFAKPVLVHLGVLLSVILGFFAWGYWLDIWELVFSSRGVVFGASYADMHAKLPALWILMVVVILCIIFFIYAIWQRKMRWLLYGIVGWISVAIVVGGIFPALIQRLQVQPSELAKERQYIEHNIEFTREAFALNRIEEQPYPAEEEPTISDITENEVTISNIRLWDPRPLKDTYNQIQSIRLYYDFNDVDIDRYEIDGDYRQVMLSARELSADKLSGQAQTWVNRRLQFTHGYGLALSPVNEVTSEGLPVLLVKDIPPVGDFEIKQPQIYYGEKTDEYVIANTNTQEFDYPMGDENVYANYEGSGGISLNNFMRRFLYAWQLGDFNILISSELTAESRLLYYRNIQERVNRLAPFLYLDSDPYLVVMDGRLFWIQDAYTVTDRYPYSEPVSSNINYIRNSVKAVVDAYNGNVTFYVTEPEDALIRTYQSIFPQLFVDAEQMPEAMRAHLRYPEDMFNIQAAMYRNYHMQDARVFYNKEDLWAIPKEVYAGSQQALEPYYIIMRLLGEEKEEFLLMLPFTPVNKNNTIGWLAARCDGDNYGKLLAYHFPKEKLVYGPSQIENRIQQDTVITEQLALWGRGGSRVIRGNLLLIPLGESKIYVEPVFLQADAGGLPELKRVIVAAGDMISMEPTLQESLAAAFGTDSLPAPSADKPAKPAEPVISEGIADLIKQAQEHYSQAQQYLKDGDWSGYGKELDALKAVLEELSNLVVVE